LRIFNDISYYFSLLYSKVVWNKILALLMSGLTGCAITILIGIALFRLAILAVKVTLIYMFNIILLSMLILMLPVLSISMFYKIGGDIFNRVVKYLIALTVFPSAVFSVFFIFNIVIIQLAIATFNYTICDKCFLSLLGLVSIFMPFATPIFAFGDIGSFCLFAGKTLLIETHMPSGATANTLYVPVGVAISALAFLGIALSCDKFLSVVLRNIYQIMSVTPIGQGAGTGLDGAAQNVMDQPGKMFGAGKVGAGALWNKFNTNKAEKSKKDEIQRRPR